MPLPMRECALGLPPRYKRPESGLTLYQESRELDAAGQEISEPVSQRRRLHRGRG